MPIPITFNGQSYNIPTVGDSQWGDTVTNYLVAISQGTPQKSGGSFPILADVNFGNSYGLVSKYYKSTSNNIAISGTLS